MAHPLALADKFSFGVDDAVEKQLRDHFSDILVKTDEYSDQRPDVQKHIKKQPGRLHAEHDLKDRQMS